MSNGSALEDVNTVMTQVLVRMEKVVEHLRLHNENEAANRIAKNIIAIVAAFNEVTAPWDIEQSTMEADLPLPSAHVAPTIERAPSVARPSSQAAGTSWASIAAIAPAAGNHIVRFTPSDGLQTKLQDDNTATQSSMDNDRVVWIRNWTEKRRLSDVTENVGHGPIYSMAFSAKEKSVCIIFQAAASAQALCSDDRDYTNLHGRSRFGRDCEVISGMPFPTNEDINRMESPLNERRRLTFARQQLFTNGMTEQRFRADIFSIVGAVNVELVWLFNTGNATVVLSAVPLARLVRDEFRKRSREPNSPYKGVIISFSHDPCERPMSLITQLPVGRSLRCDGTYGRSMASTIEGINENRRVLRRGPNCDSEGWQTVGRRH